MRTSRVKAKLAQGQPALITTLHLCDPSLFEMASLMGFDALWIDLEHHGTSVETAAQLMRAARVGSSDILARPAKGEMMRMCRLLEMGAQGIMYPRCSTAAEAAEVARWVKFAPEGTRGVDSANADNPYCGTPLVPYLRQANAETFLIVQIEDTQALEEAEAMASVDGVDGLMLGPGDFSILSGVPGQWDHPLLADATRRVAEAARAAGKHWGQPAFSPQHAERLLEQGARLIFHGADVLILKAGLEAMQRDFTALGFTFDNRLGG